VDYNFVVDNTGLSSFV